MEQNLVTIVLPIYNVEAYLERCIHSMVNQTYKNLEIILVDDGSPDQCPGICDEWAERDSRIKVIHKENAGLGMARNTGIENAKGEYICFFDSDDYIAPDTIEKSYKLAKREEADVVVFGFAKVYGDIKESIIPSTEKRVYRKHEVQEIFLPDLLGMNPKNGKKTNLWMSAWDAMYSMPLIQKYNWQFVSERDIISEDIYSLLYLYKYVDTVAVLPEPLYFHCENQSSLTHVYRSDRYDKIKHFYDCCQNAARDLGYGREIKERLAYPYIANTIMALKIIVTADCDKKKKKTAFKSIVSDKHFRKVIHRLDTGKEKIARKILFQTVRHRMYRLCYFLVRLKA